MKPNILLYPTLPTTMLEARAKAREGHPEGTTILAMAQTSGRGRLGRSWLSEPGQGVWMTTILRPPKERAATFSELSLVVGIAVCKAVQAMGVTEARLKWPNDVLVGDKKLAGILLESDDGVVLAGIGLNLTKAADRTLPADIAPIYTGLLDHTTPDAWSMRDVADDLTRELGTWYDVWKADGFSKLTETYAALDALKDSDVRVAATDGTQVAGKARGVNAKGELRVETDAGMTEVRAGEVERVRR